MSQNNLVVLRNLRKHFRLPGGWLTGEKRFVYAVDGIDLEIAEGEVFGLVGESGCGKTTLGRIVLRLIEPTEGEVQFDGKDLLAAGDQAMRRIRRDMQLVFQNPLSSLSPRMKVFDIISEPLRTHKAMPRETIAGRVVELLTLVGLGEQHLYRYPHEMSGGQCQRVAIARALALNPRLIVLDEPTSALDVSVQAQIINLLDNLKKQQKLTYIFISHDLNVVHHLSDRIGVMYLGKIVEVGDSEDIFNNPLHPYTRALLEAIPMPEVQEDHEWTVLEGNVPSPTDPPAGCRFHTRCPIAVERCTTVEPRQVEVRAGRYVACHLVEAQELADADIR